MLHLEDLEDREALAFFGFIFLLFFLGIFAGIFNHIFTYVIKGVAVINLALTLFDLIDTLLHTKKEKINVKSEVTQLAFNILFSLALWFLPLMTIEIVGLVVSLVLIFIDWLL